MVAGRDINERVPMLRFRAAASSTCRPTVDERAAIAGCIKRRASRAERGVCAIGAVPATVAVEVGATVGLMMFLRTATEPDSAAGASGSAISVKILSTGSGWSANATGLTRTRATAASTPSTTPEVTSTTPPSSPSLFT